MLSYAGAYVGISRFPGQSVSCCVSHGRSVSPSPHGGLSAGRAGWRLCFLPGEEKPARLAAPRSCLHHRSRELQRGTDSAGKSPPRSKTAWAHSVDVTVNVQRRLVVWLATGPTLAHWQAAALAMHVAPPAAALAKFPRSCPRSPGHHTSTPASGDKPAFTRFPVNWAMMPLISWCFPSHDLIPLIFLYKQQGNAGKVVENRKEKQVTLEILKPQQSSCLR
ncbi:uncharacterized protein [Struthio camelus]|uniref:uncharacterized protein n=1 Tax=Struthio camelus TaxID=8801 RepID=UPI003603C9A2